MYLPFGVNKHGELISIDQASRGRTGLVCPYCAKPLIARKGKIKAHHFAHAEDTCRAVESRAGDYFSVPLFETFNLSLTKDEIAVLSYYSTKEETSARFRSKSDYWLEQKLLERDYLKHAYQRTYRSPEYALTHKGKIPLGELSMSLFEEQQQILIEEKLDAFASNISKARKYEGDYSEPLTDYRLFRAQLRRLLESTLYFLEINHSEGKLYKIGITGRTVEDRAKEIDYFVRQAGFTDVGIKILGNWEQRGYLEPYFIYRYAPYRAKVAESREYFAFEPAQLKKVLSYDLRRLPDRFLQEYEVDILQGEPGALERILEEEDRALAEAEARAEAERLEQERQEQIEMKRRKAIRVGMKKAKKAGKHIGRPKGATESDAQLLEKYHVLTLYIKSGFSLRKAARLAGVSVNTVRKVKSVLENQEG